jgi:hypothetical protein
MVMRDLNSLEKYDILWDEVFMRERDENGEVVSQ